MLLDPPGAAAGERMARALGAERRAVAVEHARQRLGRSAGTREAAVEDVALHALGAAHGVHGEGEAGDAVLELQPVERVAHQAHPRALVGARARRMKGKVEGLSVREREAQRERRRAFAESVQRFADAAGEPVDDEEQALRVVQQVLAPRERRMREGAGDGLKEWTDIVGACQPPEGESHGAEAHFDRLAREPREIAAMLDAGAAERGKQLAWRLEHGDRPGSEYSALYDVCD